MALKKLAMTQQVSVIDLVYFYNLYCKMREQTDRYTENHDQSKKTYDMLGKAAKVVRNMQRDLGIEFQLCLVSEKELAMSISLSEKMAA